jgi:glutamine synthetase
VRTIDGTANPYLAFAAILGLGLVGIRKGLELEIEESDEPAVNLSAEERQKRGIVGRFQRTLSAAREVARNDRTINEVLGEEFVQTYLDVNEVCNFDEMTREPG